MSEGDVESISILVISSVMLFLLVSGLYEHCLVTCSFCLYIKQFNLPGKDMIYCSFVCMVIVKESY